MCIKPKTIGFTLVELMISLSITAVIMVGLITAFALISKHSKESIKISRLNQQLQAAVNMMAADIQRAGYWGNAINVSGSATNNNPFMDANTSMDIATNDTNNCITLSYDSDKDGSVKALNAALDDERYGYRVINNQLQIRPSDAAFSCDAAATNWEDLIDSDNISINNLQFTIIPTVLDLDGVPGGPTVVLRKINIRLTGHLVDMPTITKTINTTVKIRNDKYVP